MKLFFNTIILYACMLNVATAQSVYDSLIAKATEAYESKFYCKAGTLYNKAFSANNDKGKVDDRINAAACWALCNVPDSAFSQLEKIASRAKYSDAYALTSNEDLLPLQKDKRWQHLMEQVFANKKEAFSKLKYSSLAAMLDSMFTKDQEHRAEIMKVQRSETKDSVFVKSLWNKMALNDSLNLITVESVIEKFGWLGKEDIGSRGVLTMFLVIHHTENLNIQLKYMPILRQAAADGKLEMRHFAIFEDRVLIGQGKKQLYGSQIGTDEKTGKNFIMPIEDEPNVNKRRAAAGLDPLEIYAKNWGIDYQLPKSN
jgi:hypothetical protein